VLKVIPESIFHLYALSRPRGLAFGNRMPTGAWMNEDGSAWGCLLENGDDGTYSFFVMRRRVDEVWMETQQGTGFPSKAEAYAELQRHAKDAGLVELPPATPRRPPLHDAGDREPGEVFLCLAQPSRRPAAWMLNQLYLSLPHPDPNWASDCQTQGFHTRLWEAHLLACLREQGLLVSQLHESPDFRVEDEGGEVAWIEAVTANPRVAKANVTSGAAFRAVDRYNNVTAYGLHRDSIAEIFKTAAKRAGINATNIAGHSVRAGMATQAALNGSSERAIAKTTRHKSRRVLRRYIRPGELFRENASASLGL
jgi:hypothetical protein